MTGIDPTPTDRLRNVLLLGHGGTGKTALAEALLRVGGVGDTRGGVLDTEPEERDRGHSLGVAVASVAWNGHRLNLIDAPGMPDAIGDAYPALRAADVAVFVVDAAAGVQPQHDELWAACDELGLPRLVVLNKLDRENAGYQRNIDALRERCGRPLAPVHMPIGLERDFTGVIDLLRFTAVEVVDGRRRVGEVSEERREQAERNREYLVEAIVEQDDTLLERYLEGQVPDADELAACFARGIAAGSFFPVLCASATRGIGVQLLADFIAEECPSPAQRGADPGGPFAATVVKTLSDPFVGRITVLRVERGRVHEDENAVSARTGAGLRLHQLFRLQGREQEPVSEACAGDLVAVAKLDDVRTGDVLHAKDAPFEADVPRAPRGFHRVAVEPASAGDEDKLSTALARIVEEDPSLQVERDADSAQLVLNTYGPSHVDVTLARLERKFGVRVEQVPLRLAYRETLRGSGSGLGRHVKQSGGHGQYAIAEVEVLPLPRGEGFVFEDKIVGGVVPKQFIPSVEKGVREAMAQGVRTDYPLVDVHVRLVDGKHHSVDSSQLAFEVAGSLAFRAAAEQAGVVLLEPILHVEVTVPDDLLGDVMGDLSARRGRIQGTEPSTAPGRTTVVAHVPEAELLAYAADLRSLSRGSGTARMRFDHYEEVPEQVASRIVEGVKETAAM